MYKLINYFRFPLLRVQLSLNFIKLKLLETLEEQDRDGHQNHSLSVSFSLSTYYLCLSLSNILFFIPLFYSLSLCEVIYG